MVINTTCTAMPRPEIVEQTFKSFTESIRGVNWREQKLHINIDPFPHKTPEDLVEIDKERRKVIDVGKKYFGEVNYRMPVHRIPNGYGGNYSDAYKWVWGNAESEIILNLEDDWVMNRHVQIGTLLSYFDNCPTLYEVVLRAYTYHYPCTCTSPALLHRRYYRPISSKFNIMRNPETQTHSRNDLGIFIPNKNNCKGEEIFKYVRVYPEKCGEQSECIAVDNGREWMENSKYARPQMLQKRDRRWKKKDQFTAWVIK